MKILVGLLLLGLSNVALTFLLDCDRFERRPPSEMIFQYIVKNSLVSPPYIRNITIPIVGCNDTTVIEYMQVVADQQSKMGDTDSWSFTLTYYTWGYFISEINGFKETSGSTYWELMDHKHNNQHFVGASTYIPQPGDQLTWNLTTYGRYLPEKRPDLLKPFPGDPFDIDS